MTKKNINKNAEKDNRYRNWVFVAYPESMPENWRDILTELNLTWCCSPLHDLDTNENAEGGVEKKKPHYHFILKFDGKKNFEQIKEITDLFNAPIPQKCSNIVGAVRYLIHRDNPEKAQYKETDIQEGGGFDYASYLKLSPAQEREILKEIFKHCRANGIDEISDLNDYILDEKEEWFPVSVAYSAHIYRVLRSAKCKAQEIKAQEHMP